MTHPDAPSWKAKLRAGRLAALEAMTAEEQAQRAEDDAARRRDRAHRRALKAAQALLVNQRLALGDTPDEIAARLGITVRALHARARTWGHAVMQRKGFRRLASWLDEGDVQILDTVAVKWGMSREKALAEIVKGALAAKAAGMKRGAAA